MNIWQWVTTLCEELRERGQERLATLLEEVPGLVCASRTEEACSRVDEGLALAREARLPWATVYLRHWRLQDALLRRLRVREYLPEAVDLLEYTSREETRGCPQSVCATQDLVIAYAHVDAEGYAEERRAAAEETLARIDASWPCFECLSGEYADALVDGGEPAAALAFLERQRDAMVVAGSQVTSLTLAVSRLEALCALGRYEEAAELARFAREVVDDAGSPQDLELGLLEARALAELGRGEQARALVIDEAALALEDRYLLWAEATWALCRAGARENDWRLHATLGRLIQKLTDQGALSYAFSIALLQASAAAARARPLSLLRALSRLEQLAAQHRYPERALRHLGPLEVQLSQLQRAGDALDPAPASGLDPEQDLARAASLPEREREAPEHAQQAAAAWSALEEREQSLELLERAQRLHPRHEGLASDWLSLLSQAGDEARFFEASERLLATESAELVSLARRARAEYFRKRGEPRSAEQELELLLASQPEHPEARGELATVLRERGAFEAALAQLDALVEAGAAPGAADWDRMTVAAILGRWEVVRASAARLGIEVPEGEGPIDEESGLCRLRIVDDQGESLDLYARRISPVTARVLELRAPALPSYFGDVWAFDAGPLNRAPEDDEAEHHTWLYPAVQRIASGQFVSYDLDGVHPGTEALSALREAAAEGGYRLQIASGEHYTVTLEDGSEARGLYGFLGAPAHVPAGEVHAFLERAARELPTPLLWPKLADAAGQPAAAARFREQMEQLGIHES